MRAPHNRTTLRAVAAMRMHAPQLCLAVKLGEIACRLSGAAVAVCPHFHHLICLFVVKPVGAYGAALWPSRLAPRPVGWYDIVDRTVDVHQCHRGEGLLCEPKERRCAVLQGVVPPSVLSATKFSSAFMQKT